MRGTISNKVTNALSRNGSLDQSADEIRISLRYHAAAPRAIELGLPVQIDYTILLAGGGLPMPAYRRQEDADEECGGVYYQR